MPDAADEEDAARSAEELLADVGGKSRRGDASVAEEMRRGSGPSPSAFVLADDDDDADAGDAAARMYVCMYVYGWMDG